MSRYFYRYSGADRIAVAFLPAQSDGHGVANILHRVAQNPELRPIPVFEDHFQTPVVVEVGEREGSAIVGKVQSRNARDVGKRTIVVIHVENVSLIAIPRGVRSDQLIDGVPPQLVIR